MKKEKGGNKESSSSCICPNCSEEVPQQRVVPCSEQKCPSCGTKMMKDINGKNTSSNRSPRIEQKNTRIVDHPTVEQEKCVGCRNCADACPMNAVTSSPP